MLKKIALIIIILCSLKFYQISFLPEIAIKLTEWIGVALIFALLIIYIVYSREKLYKKYFTLPVILIIISVIISMFSAYAFHEQPFPATIIAQRAIYFYLIYFLLHYMKIPADFIIKTIVAFAFVYMGIYFVQYILFPTQITYSRMFLDRGTLRIFISGGGYLVISFFIWLYLLFRAYKTKYIIFLLAALGIFVLLGTRQVIASIMVLTILFILQSEVVKSKVLIFSMIAIGIIPIYILFQDIIYAMFEVTIEQSQAVESNVRVKAIEYFMTEFFPNNIAYFTGNGAEGSSMYGLRVINIMKKYGYYQSDIGIIGEYTRYGVLYVIGVIIILFRVLTVKIPEKIMFVKYNFLGILMTSLTGGGSFGSSGTNILINCMLLYLVDLHLNNDKSLKNYLL